MCVRFSRLVKELKEKGLMDALAEGEHTVFAPTDDAFIAFSDGPIDYSVEQLSYHIINEKKSTLRLRKGAVHQTLNPEHKISMTFGPLNRNPGVSAIYADDALVLEADFECDDGVIHVIDKLLFPGTWVRVDEEIQ